MSTQLYSNWLTKAKPKCYLPFELPSRVNLPIDYQPKLYLKLNELQVDFTLETKILLEKDQIIPISQHSLENGASGRSILKPSLVNYTNKSEQPNPKENTSTELSGSTAEGTQQFKVSENDKQEQFTPTSSVTKPEYIDMDMSYVLDQFDTLNLGPSSQSPDVRSELTQIFTTPGLTVPGSSSEPAVSRSRSMNHSPQPPSSEKNTHVDFGTTTLVGDYIPTISRSTSNVAPSKNYHSASPLPYNSSSYLQTHPSNSYGGTPSNYPYHSTSPSHYYSTSPNPKKLPPTPPPKPQSEYPSLDTQKLDQLTAMGFDKDQAHSALLKHNNSLDQAIESLLLG